MATKPGERKQQILETLAKMLESPKREKITTAALAAKLDVSEAALYRHFAGKAQMFEGLIEFIKQTLFGLINKIMSEETDGLKQVQRIVSVLLLFAEKNPGMTRVLIGDALVNEVERLQFGSTNYSTAWNPLSSKACASPKPRPAASWNPK